MKEHHEEGNYGTWAVVGVAGLKSSKAETNQLCFPKGFSWGDEERYVGL